jgi:polyphosphate kinase 2 (PPK2 family)
MGVAGTTIADYPYAMAGIIEHDDELLRLRARLSDLQQSQVFHNRRALILLEGLPGSGKKAALRQIAAGLDPCHFTVHASRFDRREASDGHWLARFWRQLPGAGDTTIFYRGWYRRVLDDRLAGRVEDKAAERAFDEINEFEAQQRDAGTVVAKLFFTVDPAIQKQRLAERARSPWHRESRAGPITFADDPHFQAKFAEMRAHTDTRWSPWSMVDGSDAIAGARSALRALTEIWAAAMPSEPAHLVSGGKTAA